MHILYTFSIEIHKILSCSMAKLCDFGGKPRQRGGSQSQRLAQRNQKKYPARFILVSPWLSMACQSRLHPPKYGRI